MLGEYGIDFIFEGELQQSICILLQSHGYDRVYNHCCHVAEEAVTLARRFNVDEEKAKTAALLHDIGVVILNSKREAFLRRCNMGVFPEEVSFPMIMHQKVSRVIAQQLFHIADLDILNAIECHTTLKSKASKLDMVIFLADKIQWDQNGVPPYKACIIEGLMDSLEQGSFAYIKYLLENKTNLQVIHPWLLAAYNDLQISLYTG